MEEDGRRQVPRASVELWPLPSLYTYEVIKVPFYYQDVHDPLYRTDDPVYDIRVARSIFPMYGGRKSVESE